MNPLDLIGLSTLPELLAGKLVDCLKHHESRLPARSFLLPQEALVQQGGDALEGLHWQISFRVADGLYGFQGAAPGEDRKPPEEHLLAFVEERMAPLDGSPQGPLPLWEVAGSACKELQAAAKPVQQRIGREHLDPRCSKFYGQGKTVKPYTDLGNSRGTLVGNLE